jgi:quercetin dioxygenase-like cupin family protein
MKLAASLMLSALALAQSAGVIIPDLAKAKWTHEANEPPGAESIFLRQDEKTGGMDLLVRYAPGQKLAAHWHSVNERLILIEGKVTVKVGEGAETTLVPGAFSFVPAKEPHRLACVSDTRCTFYIAWDGKLDSHKVQ